MLLDFWHCLRVIVKVWKSDRQQSCDTSLVDLPETMKFEVREADEQFDKLFSDALKLKAIEVACRAKQSNKTPQQLNSRCQAIGESNQGYVAALHRLEEIAYPNIEEPKQKTMRCTMC